MAEIRWTDDQLEAIETSGCNILVSAAAGSGKTAVLVERIVRMLSDQNDPKDIDSMIVMTFTKAAAAQMKEKILKKIRAALKDDPENEHLRRQAHKVHNARICTIDSLCMNIVKENFHKVDIDPGFRIAEEAETAMIKDDVLKELIESKYQRPTQGFIHFVNSYIDKSDSKIEEIILQVHTFAQSHPDPVRWIQKLSDPYLYANNFYANSDTDERVAESCKWLEGFSTHVMTILQEIRSEAEQGIEICTKNYGPYKYEPLFARIIEFTESLTCGDVTSDAIREAIAEELGNWVRLPLFSKKDDVNEDLKEIAKDIRATIKAQLEKLYVDYFADDLEGTFRKMHMCYEAASEIKKLALEFGSKFKARKKELKIADFGDVAHYALDVLLEKDEKGRYIIGEDGEYVFSETADRMAGEIEEIIIDEYQDTNELQETLVKALSGARFGRPDVFMVGDIKQSIYGFRMADPSIFREKYNSYGDGEGGKRILLNANFRSRKEVLNITNYIFDQIMIDRVGGIEYENGHALVYGAGDAYPEPEDNSLIRPEIILVNSKGEKGREQEAYAVAQKIEDIVNNGYVTEDGQFRKAGFRDIAVLSRNANNPELERILDERKIPVIKSSNKGFFDAPETRLALNLLNIIDNPFQDIVFTSVLTSPVVGISSNELARIRVGCEEQALSIYAACREYAEKSADERLQSFLGKLEKYRKKASYMGICDFLEYVFSDSGLENIICSMPGGESRTANLNMLKAKAAAYSQGSYSGLFNFIRYIEKMKDNDIDFGQAQVFSEDADAVRMMTIHKSKGLEFPVVILYNCAKQFNKTDSANSVILDAKYGVGIEFRDTENRLKSPSALMTVIKSKKNEEAVGEEARLLYVAMTRAKEKLIMTASENIYSKSMLPSWMQQKYNTSKQLGYSTVTSCGSYLKMIGNSIIRSKNAGVLDGDQNARNPLYDCGADFDVTLLDEIDVLEERAEEIADTAERSGDIADKIRAIIDGKEADAFSFRYAHEKAVKAKIKVTASQLEKHENDESRKKINKRELSEEEENLILKGTERGNAYHKFFELLDYSRTDLLVNGSASEKEKFEAIRAMKDEFLSKGLMDEKHADAVDAGKIIAFLESELGRRMSKAASEGKLTREQQFVMSVRDDDSGEDRLLQGIIDAFFEEEGEIVIVDYKTDKGKKEADFISEYKPQLDAYKDAVEAAMGIKVKGEFVYSVELEKEIELK